MPSSPGLPTISMASTASRSLPVPGSKPGGLSSRYSFDDHGLAHAAVAVNGNPGTCASPWGGQSGDLGGRALVPRADRGPGAAGFDRSNSCFRWALTEGPPLRASGGQSHCSRGLNPVSSTKGTGSLQLMLRKRAPAVVIHSGVLAPAGTSDQCGCLRRAVHKLPLRDPQCG